MAVVPVGGVGGFISPQIFGAAIGAVTQLVVTTLVGASTVSEGCINAADRLARSRHLRCRTALPSLFARV